MNKEQKREREGQKKKRGKLGGLPLHVKRNLMCQGSVEKLREGKGRDRFARARK